MCACNPGSGESRRFPMRRSARFGSPGESGTSLDEVVAYYYNVDGERNMASLSEVLQANAGKTVVVTYNMRDYTG